MGCSEAKSGAHSLRIRYKDADFSLNINSEWTLIQSKLYEMDPLLQWKAWKLHSKTPAMDLASADDLDGYRRLGNKRKGVLEVKLESGYRLPEGVHGTAVALLLGESGEIKGCCVLVTPTHLLTSSELVPSRDSLRGMSVFFPPKTRIPLKRGGAYLLCPTLLCALCELKTEAPVSPVKIREFKGRYSPVQVLYMIPTCPALQLLPEIRLIPEGKSLEAMDTAPSQSLGAGLFHQDWRFAGVYVGMKRGKPMALLIWNWVKFYREAAVVMEDDERNYVLEVFRDMGVSERSESRNYGVRGAVTDNKEVVVELVDDFSNTLRWEPSLPYHLHRHPAETQLWSHNYKQERVVLKNTLEVKVGLGCTVTVTDNGVLIAGGDPPSLGKAYLWNQTLHSLPALPASHTYHCAAYLPHNRVYLIGGVQCSSVTSLHTQSNSWSPCCQLPSNLSHAGASGYNDAVYVAGGLLSTGLRTSQILHYSPARNQWCGLETALDLPLSDFGMKVLSEKDILIFGGETDAGSWCEWRIVGKEGGSLEVPGNFRESGVGWGDNFEVFSEEGALFRYHCENKTFALLCRPS